MWPVKNSIPLIGWNYSIHTGENNSTTAGIYRWNIISGDTDFFQKINVPPMRALKFITGHMIYNLAYTLILQMKETQILEALNDQVL